MSMYSSQYSYGGYSDDCRSWVFDCAEKKRLQAEAEDAMCEDWAYPVNKPMFFTR